MASTMKRMAGWMAAAGLCVVALTGCGGPITYTIKGSPKSPELDGKFVAEPLEQNRITTLDIALEHLAPPDRLGSGKYFLAWARDDKGKWRRVGALEYDEKGRKGKLGRASFPQTSFDFQVTVEGSIDASEPSGEAFYFQHVN